MANPGPASALVGPALFAQDTPRRRGPPVKLADVDLNLLVYLDALLTECHVTNASKRVGLSQSAMSRALARLRDLFEDELLTKTPHGMSPTPLATQLRPQVKRVLREIERTVGRAGDFDPAQDARTFTLSADAWAAWALLPALIEELGARAPGVSLRARARAEELPRRALLEGRLQLALDLEEPPRALRARALTHDTLCVLARRAPPLTLEDYLARRHVLVTGPAAGQAHVDAALERRGQRRVPGAHAPDLHAARRVAAQTDLLVTLPCAMTEGAGGDLERAALPLQLGPLTLSMVWGPQAEEDPACRWLRELVSELCAQRFG